MICAGLGSFGTPLPKNSVYFVPVLRRVTSLRSALRRNNRNLTCCPSMSCAGVEQHVAVLIPCSDGASTAKSRVGPGPSASREKLTMPHSGPLIADTITLSLGSPQVPTAVTLPSGSTTAILSKVVRKWVLSGWSSGLRPSHVLLVMDSCTVSPMCKVECDAERLSGEILKRNHKAEPTSSKTAAIQKIRRINPGIRSRSLAQLLKKS